MVTQTRYDLEREFDFEEERKKLTKGFEEEQKKLTKDSEGLNDAMDELDDLMKIAPDQDQKKDTKTADNTKQPTDP